MNKPSIIIQFDGPCVIWHSAGWGKDSVLMEKASKAISKGKDPDEVCKLLKEAGFEIFNTEDEMEMDEFVRELSAKNLVSALIGCSIELSLVDEVPWEPGLLTKEELQEDEARFIKEIKRRLDNQDPDMEDAVGEGSALWKRIKEIVKSTN